MLIKFKKFNQDLPFFNPEYKTSGAAGMDVFSSLNEEVIIKPGERVLIPTNLVLEIPHGYEAQVRPRSGLALKHGVTVLNSPGTIDSDYRGEVLVLLINLGKEDYKINSGDRIAQIIFSKHEKVTLKPDSDLSKTERDMGGYGSTGIRKDE